MKPIKKVTRRGRWYLYKGAFEFRLLKTLFLVLVVNGTVYYLSYLHFYPGDGFIIPIILVVFWSIFEFHRSKNYAPDKISMDHQSVTITKKGKRFRFPFQRLNFPELELTNLFYEIPNDEGSDTGNIPMIRLRMFYTGHEHLTLLGKTGELLLECPFKNQEKAQYLKDSRLPHSCPSFQIYSKDAYKFLKVLRNRVRAYHQAYGE